MTVIADTPIISDGFLWVDLTRKCQLDCGHCHNGSGPTGTHGTMTVEDWGRVLGEAVSAGVRHVQFTGGEVTMHPDAPTLIERARDLGLRVEVYSNMVHLTERWWTLLQQEGVSLATSYYGTAEAHNAVTHRNSHARTRANIERAVKAGIPIRVSVIVPEPTQTGERAREQLKELGVTSVRVDHVRPFGRAAGGKEPGTGGLCGRCGDGRASVSPDGEVSPCVFSTWLGVGNVKDGSLRNILDGPAMARANATIRRGARLAIGDPCGPYTPCAPESQPQPKPDDEECSPGFPGSSCSPRN
ncbi:MULTISPECIES: radical SAM/SPASM domain-containing protein [Streptomyces]|uniref:radical SAM/SPASM domain-containing protein n=1 Tax=Streptomyces TaxID=1883 RepID=UPI000FFE4D08|nr:MULTISPECIES: radical SAM/SPASM domain-containing protein [Streptomyces]